MTRVRVAVAGMSLVVLGGCSGTGPGPEPPPPPGDESSAPTPTSTARPERPQPARVGAARSRQQPGCHRQLSAYTYVDRITEPILNHNGTSDDSCPIARSRLAIAFLNRRLD